MKLRTLKMTSYNTASQRQPVMWVRWSRRMSKENMCSKPEDQYSGVSKVAEAALGNELRCERERVQFPSPRASSSTLSEWLHTLQHGPRLPEWSLSTTTHSHPIGEKRTQAETTFLSKSPLTEHPIPEGHNDSPDANRRGEWGLLRGRERGPRFQTCEQHGDGEDARGRRPDVT